MNAPRASVSLLLPDARRLARAVLRVGRPALFLSIFGVGTPEVAPRRGCDWQAARIAGGAKPGAARADAAPGLSNM